MLETLRLYSPLGGLLPNQVDFLEDFDPGVVIDEQTGVNGGVNLHDVANGYDRSEEVIPSPYNY